MVELCYRDPVSTEQKNVIVIGIDFGTTFSGVSWAFSGQPKNVEVITQWASELNFNSDTEKTPSTLLYRGLQDEAFWGYNIPAASDEEALKWFKLLLIDAKNLSPDLQKSCQIATAKRLLDDANRDTVEAVSSYLRRLWNHAIDHIGQSTGIGLMKLCKFHVVITLPAIWPEYSKARMKRAVENAGILETRPAGDTVLSFISEPEAAALATMEDLKNRPDIRDGDHFVVCDAGGGTVDLISYEIVGTSPMAVKEAVKGNGRLCGGVFLDQAFVELLRRQLSPGMWDAMSKDEVQRLLNDNWEHGIKKQFYGQQKDWVVTMPQSRQQKSHRSTFRRGTLILSHADLDPVFRPIAKEVEDLVGEQIHQIEEKHHRKVKYIILVGGFGRCPYLYTYLARELANSDTSSTSARIETVRTTLSWKYLTNYDPQVHLKIDRTWDAREMIWKADNQMKWYLTEGTDVCETKAIRDSYYRLYDKPPSEIVETLWYSAHDDLSLGITLTTLTTQPNRPSSVASHNLPQTSSATITTHHKEMIDPEFGYWAPGGAIFPRVPSTWYILSIDQRRIIAVTMDGKQESEDLAVEILKKHIDTLPDDVYAIKVSPDGNLTSMSTDPEDDETLCVHYPPLGEIERPEGIRTIVRSELQEIDRLGPDIDLVSYQPHPDDNSPKKVVFKYYFLTQFIQRAWNEMNLWMRLPRHPNIVPVDRLVVDELKGRVVRFTSIYIPGGTLEDNQSRVFKLKWIKQLTRVVGDLNLKHGTMHQDINARNLLVDPSTDNLLLFDFDFSGRIGGTGYVENRNDIKGVIFTLYEIITRDNHFREVPHEKQKPMIFRGCPYGPSIQRYSSSIPSRNIDQFSIVG
ncbi:hypothetical protein CSAL01_00326 [Colletotrichum salicis]|uniref:Protein kinase domain-containing protein n=1 Tax=Colletotrichum salicis TaxID=1209931 RepID=A0A135RST0_9PEZI|nr:hypothetical protein CSAL01_00326 [Colletotrichum salicis]